MTNGGKLFIQKLITFPCPQHFLINEPVVVAAPATTTVGVVIIKRSMFYYKPHCIPHNTRPNFYDVANDSQQKWLSEVDVVL